MFFVYCRTKYDHNGNVRNQNDWKIPKDMAQKMINYIEEKFPDAQCLFRGEIPERIRSDLNLQPKREFAMFELFKLLSDPHGPLKKIREKRKYKESWERYREWKQALIVEVPTGNPFLDQFFHEYHQPNEFDTKFSENRKAFSLNDRLIQNIKQKIKEVKLKIKQDLPYVNYLSGEIGYNPPYYKRV